MKFIRKTWIYAQRHFDFILLDCMVFCLSFYAAIQIRRTWDIPIKHDELFLRFGIVSLLIYLAVEIFDQNLNGIVSRGMVREAETLARHMTLSWSIYTVILFLRKDAHLFSRSVYAITFFVCYISIFVARTMWKAYVKYGSRHGSFVPRLLIITDSSKVQKTLDRLLHGSFENKYEVAAIIINKADHIQYNDYYPIIVGLDKIKEQIQDKRIQGAYIELENAEEERKAIEQLLEYGVIVHRSLGDSSLNYASMRINELSDKSVITIEDATISLARKAEKLLVRIRREKNKSE